jgi:hypothetical protein
VLLFCKFSRHLQPKICGKNHTKLTIEKSKKREITTNLFKQKHTKNIGKERNLARRGHFAKEVLFVVIFYTANRNFKGIKHFVFNHIPGRKREGPMHSDFLPKNMKDQAIFFWQ